MAIDTPTKRRSVQAYDGGCLLPVADSSVDGGDRMHVAGLYAGLTFTVGTFVTAEDVFNIPPSGDDFTIPASGGDFTVPASGDTFTIAGG